MSIEPIIFLCDPFCDAEGNYYGHIPSKNASGSDFQLEVYLDASDFRRWLKRMLYEEKGHEPTEKETDLALDVIKGFALELPRREPRQDHKEVKLSALGQVIEKIA